MVAHNTGFCFALPPSLGRSPIHTRAREFAVLLYDAGFSTVVPMASYEALLAALQRGDAHAAWGPPLVCAHVERAGGVVPLRAVRLGASSYRAALVSHRHYQMTIERLRSGEVAELRAAWVDRWSMAGYVLPRHYLREAGVDPQKVFLEERMLGSYEACLDSVLSGAIDVTAMFATSADASSGEIGYARIAGKRAVNLQAWAYTDACPNDALVLSPALDAAQREGLLLLLRQLVATSGSSAVLARVFDADSFDEPAPGTYASLLMRV